MLNQDYDIKSILNLLNKRTSKKCLRLEPVLFECSQFDSKIGGIPYIPNGFEYPRSKVNGEPLRLLAQINFDDIPYLEYFPNKGILQIYIQDDEDCMYGLDFDNPTEQNDYRVIYHENVDYSANNVDKLPKFKECDKWDFIVENECKLLPHIIYQSILPCDYNFDSELQSTISKLYPNATKDDIDQISEILFEEYDYYEYNGHIIGGYPFFTQSDPRESTDYQEYNTLLLQLDTDDISGMMWGDSGVANFFIKPNDLKNRDFSDVLYNWDCY